VHGDARREARWLRGICGDEAPRSDSGKHCLAVPSEGATDGNGVIDRPDGIVNQFIARKRLAQFGCVGTDLTMRSRLFCFESPDGFS
jgi:hypothetical protein